MSLSPEEIERWRKSCIDKRQYRTKSGGEQALTWYREQGLKDEKAYLYKCQHCVGWHITSGKRKK